MITPRNQAGATAVSRLNRPSSGIYGYTRTQLQASLQMPNVASIRRSTWHRWPVASSKRLMQWAQKWLCSECIQLKMDESDRAQPQ